MKRETSQLSLQVFIELDIKVNQQINRKMVKVLTSMSKFKEEINNKSIRKSIINYAVPVSNLLPERTSLKRLSYLLYLIGHNKPINGFRPAATHPSRHFCSLRACASWLHQSMTGLPRFGLSNRCKVVLFADFRRSPHQIHVTPEHPPAYERHGRASAAAGY